MASRRHPVSELDRLDHGLQEYSKQARELPGVAGIVYVAGPERDVFVYIDEDDRELMFKLFGIERALFEMFDDQLFDFHIRFLQGRPWRTPTDGEVVYVRS